MFPSACAVSSQFIVNAKTLRCVHSAPDCICPVGADSIRPNVTGLRRPLNGTVSDTVSFTQPHPLSFAPERIS